MSKQFPWDYHPDLTAERLIEVALLIRRGRHDAVERFESEVGDDNWTLGCRAYKFGQFRITEAHNADRLPWLNIIDPSMRFIFGIGLVPVRFYRGDAEEPSAKTCRVAFPEFNQLSIAFPEEENDPLIFRFAVETDFDGSVLAIKFVGLRHQQTVLCWEVPLPVATVVRLSPIEMGDEGVELAPPQVGMPSDEMVAKGAG
ncbi:MAG TPA: hypothetical protein VD846_14955 [Allosphingosinicella sp.]|nr:hypothetical protein [Allosphingosinicella sp.]